MTIDEAAARLGLAPATLRTQARTGRIRAKRRGDGTYDITPAAVEEYRQKVQGRPGRKPTQR